MAVPLGAEGLGGVFDELEIVFAGDGGEGVHVGALAEEVDGEDGGVLEAGWEGFGEDFLDGLGVEVEGGEVDVGEDGMGSGAEDGGGGGEEAEGGGNDGVAGADAGGGEGEPKGVGAVGAADGVGDVEEGGGGLFEALRGGPRMKCWWAQTSSMAAMTSSRMRANSRLRSRSGMAGGGAGDISLYGSAWWLGLARLARRGRGALRDGSDWRLRPDGGCGTAATRIAGKPSDPRSR